MNAAEIIEQIAALPGQEQAIVIDYVVKLRRKETVKMVELEEVRVIAKRVFDRHEELFKKLAL